MNRILIPLLVLFSLFRPFSTPANNYYSSASGFWNSPACWQNGQIPPLLGGDSIFIQHAIMFQQPLILISSTVITIDTNASLCGHYQVTIPTGSDIHNYGEFDSDTVTLPGGHLYNYATGSMIVSYFGLITNGGGWHNYAGALQVGASFTCGGKNNSIDELSRTAINVFPLPAQNGLPVYIALPAGSGMTLVRIYSLSGEEIAQYGVNENSFTPEHLPCGYYLLLITDEEKRFTGKLLITE